MDSHGFFLNDNLNEFDQSDRNQLRDLVKVVYIFQRHYLGYLSHHQSRTMFYPFPSKNLLKSASLFKQLFNQPVYYSETR